MITEARKKAIRAKFNKLRSEGKDIQQASAMAHSMDKEKRLGPKGGYKKKKKKKGDD